MIFLSCGISKNICNNDLISKSGTPICLYDQINNASPGGMWINVSTNPTDLSSYLTGSNPCIDFGTFLCGQYKIKYIVGDVCCRDTSVLTINKCCSPTSICN